VSAPATRRGPILALEDAELNAVLLRAILEPAGYEVAVARDLAAARAWLEDHDPRLVLLDRHLPDGDGLDIAREVRAVPRLAGVPILLLSASVLPVDREAAEAAGCDEFLDKPVRVATLLEAVARHLG
jgi:CheY-like chemotaxis protein